MVNAAQDINVPPMRSDIEIHPNDDARFPFVVVDNVLKQRVGLDRIGKQIVDTLSVQRTASEILVLAAQHGAHPVDAILLRRHVLYLAAKGLLEGARAATNRDAEAPANPQTLPESPSGMTLVYEDGLKHRCQACGSCCSATDVGPLPKQTIEDILAHDWQPLIEGLKNNEELFRQGRVGDETVYLTQMRQDQCVFLSADKRCLIHSELGVQKKPLPCKQFPYVFTQAGNRIFVGLQMECRAHWKARNAADPTSESESELRELLADGAPVHTIRGPVRVDPGLQISLERYLALESRLIAAVRAADYGMGGLDPLIAFAKAADHELEALYAEIDTAERPFRRIESWQALFPGEFGTNPDPRQTFLRRLKHFEDHMAQFARQAADVAGERNRPWLAQRFDVLGRTVQAACSQLAPESFQAEEPEAIRTVLSDLIVSALFTKEPVRQTDLRLGLAVVGMRSWLTLAGACHRAKNACRVTVATQDVIDSMVTISKMLRERAVIDLIQEQESSIISMFLTNAEVFLQQGLPRLEGPGGI